MSAPSSPVFVMQRRDFLMAGLVASAGLTIGCRLGRDAAGGGATALVPNAFVRVSPDNSVTVIAKHLEMGQGVYTGLATLVAEELDADWAQIRVEAAPADTKLYSNLEMGPMQGTGGSSSISNSYDQLRQAGATARAMLVAAAAATWKVPAGEIMVAKGVVTHPGSGKSATFGQLATKAARMPVPASVALKDPSRFTFIGSPARLPRKDVPAKVNGSAIFTLDVKLPGLLTAVVAHPPLFGSTVKSFDPAAAKAVPGVVDVVQVPTGVAVLAKGFWAAKKGRDALSVTWDDSNASRVSSDGLFADYQSLGGTPGLVARKDGEVDRALAGPGRTIEATYQFPYLAHAAMEPMNCVVKLDRDGCEIWNGEQFQTVDQKAVAQATGLAPEKVKLNMLYAGGSFGRRANPKADYIIEAVEIAKAIGGRVPVKLVWTREDDMRAGYYRPAYVHVIRGTVDASGKPIAWHERVVGQSLLIGSPWESRNGIDESSVEGASNLPYAIPNVTVELHPTTPGIPVQWWRSVGHTHTGFATEAFIDELAHLAGKDPFEFRRDLLADHPRHRGVLELAAEKAGWGTPLPAGRGRGIAVHESFNSFVAEVAEVSVDRGRVRVHRVVCAVDCGTVVNPDIVRSQMEGGIGFGLGAALYGQITLKDGRVQQSNFNDYRVLRFAEMPAVEVHFVPSTEKPTGVGEPGVPPIAPAVANAVFAATGKRVRSLPFGEQG